MSVHTPPRGILYSFSPSGVTLVCPALMQELPTPRLEISMYSGAHALRPFIGHISKPSRWRAVTAELGGHLAIASRWVTWSNVRSGGSRRNTNPKFAPEWQGPFHIDRVGLVSA